MPHFIHRGGGRYGAVVGGQGIVPGRLVYLSKTGGEQHAWRIRDFLGGQILSSEDCPMTLGQIEALVQHCDPPPPPHNAESDIEAWEAYLTERSQVVYGDNFDGEGAPALQGPWHPL